MPASRTTGGSSSAALITHALEGETYRETGRFTDRVAIDEPARLRFRLGSLLD